MLYLQYLPEFDNYGIKKEDVALDALQNGTPEIKLDQKTKEKLNASKTPVVTVAFLLGQDKSLDGTEYYTIDKDYLTSILKTGADIKFLDYDHTQKQLKDCDGLILPGGSFVSPDIFYFYKTGHKEEILSKRARAYIEAIISAQVDHNNMPILGICAGAQMVGGLHNLHMHRSLKDEHPSNISHKSNKDHAHDVVVDKTSPLYQIMGLNQERIAVNSRHSEAMVEEKLQKYLPTDMKIYAKSSSDNIPEAWGNEDRHILCIQWHPENLAAKGDTSMQRIYNWLTTEAEKHSKEKHLDFLQFKNRLLKSY